MAIEFKFNASADVAKQREGKGVDTGVHEAKITKTLVYQSKNGNNIMDIFFETKAGGQFAVYGMCIDEKWASGAENFDYPTFMELALSAGMKSGEMYDTEREITKDGNKVKEKCKAFKELENKMVFVGVYWEIDAQDNKERKTRKIQRVFNAQGLSVAEAEAGNPAKTMKKLEDKISDYETKAYKAWKENGGTPSSVSGNEEAMSAGASSSSDDDLI